MDEQQPTIDTIVGSMRRIAVVGVSDNPARPSHEVAAYLISKGFTVLPVNPSLQRIFDLECSPDVGHLQGEVDVVDVFRRSSEAGAVVDDAIAIGARAVWLQEGVIDEAAGDRARAAGLLVVMDRCILKEHAARAARNEALA